MDRVRRLLNIDLIQERGFTGKGVGVAILDTGIVPHRDVRDNILIFRDYVNGRKELYDDNGHGTHVAGIIAGRGNQSNGIYRGIAPDAKLIVLKCLDEEGNGSITDAGKCIDFIIENRIRYNIRIVNISIGSVLLPDSRDNGILIENVEKLWRSGLVVTVAAGNNGPDAGSITVPGCAKSVITVGAYDNDRERSLLRHDGHRYSYNRMNTLRKRTSAHYSGRGPTDSCIVKPEIVCPGTDIMSCAVGNRMYSKKSGTSMSAPVVAGVIALMLERYPFYTNKQVKKRIFETAIDLGYEKNYQGWGLINPVDLILK